MKRFIELDLHFTNRCNIRCKHCLYSSGEDVGEVPIGILNKMVSEFADIGLETIHIGGGEPLIRYDELLLFIENASKNQVTTRLITNGYLLTKDKLAELMRCGLNEVLVSIDGTEEYNDDFRNLQGAYQSAMRAVHLSMNAGISTRINSVLTKKNADILLDFMKITTSLPVDVHGVLCLSPLGRGKNIADLVPDFDDVSDFINKVKKNFSDDKIYTKLKIQKGFLEPESGDVYDSCRIDKRENALIYSTGFVFPCVKILNYSIDKKENNYSLGNINNKSIKEIWTDEEKWRIYNRSLLRDSHCQQKLCNGGCRGLMLATTDDINACDYRCTYNKDSRLPSCIRRYEIAVAGRSE